MLHTLKKFKISIFSFLQTNYIKYIIIVLFTQFSCQSNEKLKQIFKNNYYENKQYLEELNRILISINPKNETEKIYVFPLKEFSMQISIKGKDNSYHYNNLSNYSISDLERINLLFKKLRIAKTINLSNKQIVYYYLTNSITDNENELVLTKCNLSNCSIFFKENCCSLMNSTLDKSKGFCWNENLENGWFIHCDAL